MGVVTAIRSNIPVPAGGMVRTTGGGVLAIEYVRWHTTQAGSVPVSVATGKVILVGVPECMELSKLGAGDPMHSCPCSVDLQTEILQGYC